jgi:hypothetical protein
LIAQWLVVQPRAVRWHAVRWRVDPVRPVAPGRRPRARLRPGGGRSRAARRRRRPPSRRAIRRCTGCRRRTPGPRARRAATRGCAARRFPRSPPPVGQVRAAGGGVGVGRAGMIGAVVAFNHLRRWFRATNRVERGARPRILHAIGRPGKTSDAVGRVSPTTGGGVSAVDGPAARHSVRCGSRN